MTRYRLSRKENVSTAIRIADEKGLATVTLRGIATRLEVQVILLYSVDARRDGACAHVHEVARPDQRSPNAAPRPTITTITRTGAGRNSGKHRASSRPYDCEM